MAITTGTYANRPTSHSAGDIYLTTDSFWDYLVSDGAKWKHLYSGFECEPPIDSEFSWVNQGGASVVTANGGAFLRAPAVGGINHRLRVKTAPATPYTLTALLLPSIVGVSHNYAGVAFRESSSGKLELFNLAFSTVPRFWILKLYSPTDTLPSIEYLHAPEVNVSASGIWFRLGFDGTTLTFSFSLDGQNFLQVFSEAKASFFTSAPDQIGWFVGASNASYDCGATLIHWSQPNPVSTMRVWGFLTGSGMVNGHGTGNVRVAFGD